jgi:outer membrane protein TolC
MNRFRITFLVVIAWWGMPAVSYAESGCTLPLTFEGFRAHAFAHSPLIAEIDREFSVELAKAIDTELLTNPELSVEQTYTRMKMRGDNDPQTTATLSQPLKLSNFGKRDRVAGLLRKVGDVNKRGKLLEFSQRLLLQYSNLFALQETGRFLRVAEASSTEQVAAIGQGVKEGLLSQGSESLFQGERYRLQAQREGVSATLGALQGELGLLIGTTCTVVAQAAPALPSVSASDALVSQAKTSSISEASRVELMLELTREQSRLADIDAVPVIAPRVVYQHTHDGGDFIGGGISIPFPVWNRNQAESVRAEAEHLVMRSKNQFLQGGGVEFIVRSLRGAAISCQKQADLYRLKVIPAYESALSSQERLYREGKGNVLDVWQTFRAVNEARVNELTLQLEAIRSRAQLSIMVGEEV